MLGRLATEADPLGNTTSYAYDALGNLATRTNPDGQAVTYEYDVRRLTAVVLPGGARETFGYDALGRRASMANADVSLSFVYDALNRMTQVTNHTLGETVAYGYDAAGNRTSMDGPLGRVRYLYDAKNRLVEQQDPATGTYRLDYDAADRRIGLAYPNGVATEYEYDRASRLTLLLTKDPQGNTLDGYRYTYSPVGNRTSMRSLRDDVLHDYTYDAGDRLTRWQRSSDLGGDRFETYTYDQVGNRQRLDDERGTITYGYDPANRLLEEFRTLTDGGSTTTSYTWDPNGNLVEEAVSTGSVTTYTWDALNRLTTLEGPTGTHTYGYDPTGIRVRETNGTQTTRFLHGGEDIVATYQTGTLDTYFTHGPGIDEPWAQAQPGEPDPLAYLHRDGLGSVTALSNPQAQLQGTTTYAAFGQVEQGTGLTSRYGYTSRELDPTGLMYYRARYYQPEFGRFLSTDIFTGFTKAPATLHRYTYTLSNPVNSTDPNGHFPLGVGIGVLAAVAIFVTAIAFLSERPDLWAHFLGGFAFGSILTAVGVGRFGPLGIAVAYILLAAVAVNLLLEQFFFPTGGFSQGDFWAQNLGVAVAVAIFLLLFYFFQPITRLAADTLLWFVAVALFVGLWRFVVRSIGEARAWALRRGLGA